MAAYADAPDAEELREYLSDGEEEPSFDEPPLRKDMDSAIVVANLPSVDAAKVVKLTNVLKKIFGQMGKVVDVTLPFANNDATKQTLGFAFLEFSTPAEAERAQKLTDGYHLDKTHSFKVTMFSDLARSATLSDEYEAPTDTPFVARKDPNAWLQDALQRDQFVTRHGKETEVMWCGKAGPELAYGGEREKSTVGSWCELYVNWSPQGQYLATYHRQGIALWVGDDFQKVGRMKHPGVKHVEWSPCERYCVSYNFSTATNREGTPDPRAIIVWDARKSRELRAFPMTNNAYSDPQNPEPNMFQWSSDGKYLARAAKDKAGNDVITVYTTPSMAILDSKSLRTPGMRRFQWSPKQNCLAYWAPEEENSPARVVLLEIPSRTQMRQKNLYMVSGCELYWQADGEYLAVKVVRHTKSKKTFFYNLELFSVKEPGVPIEMVNLDKVPIHDVSWEPFGPRFAYSHGDGNRHDVTVATMAGTAPGSKREMQVIAKLENRDAQRLLWSPMGGMLVVCGFGSGNSGELEFFHANAEAGGETPTTLQVVEHDRAESGSWDPSGRFFVSVIAQPLDGATFKHTMNNGYKIWSFRGELLHTAEVEEFYLFSWRPRAASLLDRQKREEISTNLKKYERQFEREDRKAEKARKYARSVKQREARSGLRQTMAELRQFYDEERFMDMLAEMRGFDERDDDHYTITSKTVEQVVSKTVEVQKD